MINKSLFVHDHSASFYKTELSCIQFYLETLFSKVFTSLFIG